MSLAVELLAVSLAVAATILMADGTIATMLMPVTTITERGTLPSGTATMLPGTRIEAAGAAAVRP